MLYNRAESILYENNCASKSEDVSGTDQRAEDSKERIGSKRRRAVETYTETYWIIALVLIGFMLWDFYAVFNKVLLERKAK